MMECKHDSKFLNEDFCAICEIKKQMKNDMIEADELEKEICVLWNKYNGIYERREALLMLLKLVGDGE